MLTGVYRLRSDIFMKAHIQNHISTMVLMISFLAVVKGNKSNKCLTDF